MDSTKILTAQLLNINKNKYFSKDQVTGKTEVVQNSAGITGVNYILYIKIQSIIYNITFFYFISDKLSLFKKALWVWERHITNKIYYFYLYKCSLGARDLIILGKKDYIKSVVY